MIDNNNNKERAANALVKKESTSPSEDGLRGVLERRGMTPNYIHRDDVFLEACRSEKVAKGVIRFLLEYFPGVARATNEDGLTPLHIACYNKNMTRGIIQLLIDAAPESVRSETNNGLMPLHILCGNDELDETRAVDILKLLIKKHPEAVRHADNGGGMPIQFAMMRAKSPEFCRVLVEAYPGSEQIADADGYLPLHLACLRSRLVTAEFLYKLYPDAINHASTQGYYPIHYAIGGLRDRSNPTVALEIVRFLLDCYPNVILQKCQGESLLDWACNLEYNDSNIGSALEVIKVIYDSYPEAMEDNRNHRHPQVQSFLNTQLAYARQADDEHLMTTPDDNGRLPLHTALQNNARLGSIKLLVKGNPSAIRALENNAALPLHIACEHHDSTSVVQYLIGLDKSTLDALDKTGDTALHYACRGAKYETIAMLLDKYDAVSISKRNSHNKLPIDILWESNAVEDRESIEYTESVFRLLREYPEMVMTSNVKHMQTRQAKWSVC